MSQESDLLGCVVLLGLGLAWLLTPLGELPGCCGCTSCQRSSMSAALVGCVSCGTKTEEYRRNEQRQFIEQQRAEEAKRSDLELVEFCRREIPTLHSLIEQVSQEIPFRQSKLDQMESQIRRFGRDPDDDDDVRRWRRAIEQLQRQLEDSIELRLTMFIEFKKIELAPESKDRTRLRKAIMERSSQLNEEYRETIREIETPR